jgi:hypothetical protein
METSGGGLQAACLPDKVAMLRTTPGQVKVKAEKECVAWAGGVV